MSRYQMVMNRIATKILKLKFFEHFIQKNLSRVYPGTYPINEFQDNDVFLVGYPKSGNTWLQNLIAGLVYGACGNNVPGSLIQELVPDVHYKSYYQRFNETTFFKSHFLPQKKYRRVIYIVRDGRDVLVSYWHYHKSLTGEELDYEKMVDSPIPSFGTWSNHLKSWLENPFHADILFLKYEDLLDDGVLQLQRICEFVGLDKSEEEVKKIFTSNEFSQLKKKEEQFGFGHGTWKTDNFFFRQGKTGSHIKEMPKPAIEKFNSTHRDMLTKMSYI